MNDSPPVERRRLVRAVETILVADDEPINRSLIQRRLERAGYHVLTAQNGQEAVDIARESLPDIVILDVMMPVMDGLEACRQIKADASTRDIPVIFLSARDETDVKVAGLVLGANDYISKPFKAEELLARVDVAMRLKRERDQLRISVKEAWAHAEVAQDHAVTDALTGLLNRYGFDRMLAYLFVEEQDKQSGLCSLMIDIDHFKLINDTYGHLVGDIAIKQVALLLKENLPAPYFGCRYGGEEFVILMPDTHLESAVAFAEKIRITATERQFGEAEVFPLTVSIGISELSGNEVGSDMIARADAALYRAKQSGRNRVEVSLTDQCDEPFET